MKRTPIKQVGKIGRRNAKANRELDKLWIEKGIDYCEACRYIYEFEGKLDWVCLQANTNAHRHSRVEYRSKPEMLYSFNQVIRACMNAHPYLDKNLKVKEAVFKLLRGKDEL